MLQGLYESGSSIMNREARQSVVTNNIANSEVTGFKRDGVFLRELGEARRKGSGGHPVWREERIAGAFIDFEQGSLRQTSSPLHLALHGPGFFQVRTPQGDVFTRNGEFSINSQGTLVSNLGHPVLNEGGGQITLTGREFNVTENGEILDEFGGVQNRLAIYDFEKDADGLYQDPDGVTRIERKPNGLFYPKPGVRAVARDPRTAVKQGFLESSNVNPVLQMVEMLDLFRSIEADQRAIRMQNESLGRAVNDVGSIRV